MMKISTLSFQWKVADSPYCAGYFEYIIDGIPLTIWIDKALNNFLTNNRYIGIIWGGNEVYNQFLKKVFLGQTPEPPELYAWQIYEYALNSRVVLYTCICGDFDCAGFWAKLEKTIVEDMAVVKWDFADVMPPFYFNQQQYEEIIEWVFTENATLAANSSVITQI
jgi:hypothetical protein